MIGYTFFQNLLFQHRRDFRSRALLEKTQKSYFLRQKNDNIFLNLNWGSFKILSLGLLWTVAKEFLSFGHTNPTLLFV